MPEKTQASAIASSVCRFTAYVRLSEAEIADLMTMAEDHREIPRGKYLVHEGDEPAGIYLLVAGWTASSVAFVSGRRQLIKIHLPGDLLGLPSLSLGNAADSIVALTDAVIVYIPRANIGRLFENSPRLAALLFLISQEERVALMDRLASIGATAAINRLAALVLEVHGRVRRALPDSGDAFDFPLLQSDVADIIGVTETHLNRTVQRLRAAGSVTWQRQRVTVHDAAALARLAQLPRRVLTRQLAWLPAPRPAAAK